MRIGVPRDYLAVGVDEAVRMAVRNAAGALEKRGAHIEEFDLGLTEYAVPAYYVIACAEAGSNLARFDGVRYGYRAKDYDGFHDMYKKSRAEGFGTEVKRRILLGSFVLSSGYYDAYYLKALRARTLKGRHLTGRLHVMTSFSAERALDGAASWRSVKGSGADVSGRRLYGRCESGGLPALSLPCGRDENGLPIGLQLIADCFEEKKLIRTAYAFEQTRSYERCPFAVHPERRN